MGGGGGGSVKARPVDGPGPAYLLVGATAASWFPTWQGALPTTSNISLRARIKINVASLTNLFGLIHVILDETQPIIHPSKYFGGLECRNL